MALWRRTGRSFAECALRSNVAAVRNLVTQPPGSAPAESPPEPTTHGKHKHVVYRGPFLLPFRMLVRGKLLQFTSAASFVLPAVLVFQGAELSTFEAVGLATLATGTGGASGALYVGELFTIPEKGGTVCVSTLDFWGNRLDEEIPYRDIVPPLKDLTPKDMHQFATQPFIPVDVLDRRQYYISLRHGDIRDKELLFQILSGKAADVDEGTLKKRT